MKLDLYNMEANYTSLMCGKNYCNHIDLYKEDENYIISHDVKFVGVYKKNKKEVWVDSAQGVVGIQNIIDFNVVDMGNHMFLAFLTTDGYGIVEVCYV